jgi:CheY-like chemotaxis protein
MYRVLVIDDEEMVSDVLSQALSLSGYNVETASGGLEGLQKFEDGLYDLVITDIWMPDMDGHGVAKGIRNSDRPSTPIIGMSGTPWALPGGEFDSIFSKPFDLHSLLNAVGELTAGQ